MAGKPVGGYYKLPPTSAAPAMPSTHTAVPSPLATVQQPSQGSQDRLASLAGALGQPAAPVLDVAASLGTAGRHLVSMCELTATDPAIRCRTR
jgi:hypothetical protein